MGAAIDRALCVAALIIVTAPLISYGQAAIAPVELQRMSFLELRDRRDVLEREVAELQSEIASRTESLREREEAEKEAADAKKRLEESKTKRNIAPEIITAISNDAANTQLRLQGMPAKEDLQKQIEDAKAKLAPKQSEKNAIESRMSELIDMERPKQEFKGTMSRWFVGLVAVVIVGFFIIVWRDEVIRRQIFSGQAGMQFITMFSLVIAIILFGITGILESKELSALLGGLSGYILGRSVAEKPAGDQISAPSRRNGVRNGFTLVELLVLVALILIVAAIMVPNLLRSRIAGNQASAVGSVRTINTAQITYASTFPKRGFPCDLSLLGPSPMGTVTDASAGLIDDGLAKGSKSGYVYAFIGPCKQNAARVTVGYKLLATPISPSAGTQSYCTDETGVIKSYVGPIPTDCFTKGIPLSG